MAVSIIVILLTALGGLGVTYLLFEEESLMRRLAAGNIIGAAILGLAAFILASLFGLTAVTVVAGILITLLPLLLFGNKSRRRELWHDWQRAKGKLDGANFQKMLRFVYYLFFFILFWFFFERAMIETSAGILTGGSQNLGDLPYHLGAIFGFTDGQNFPPQNPSFSGARFSYPFIADFLTAAVMKLGADVRGAMLIQNVCWAFSLLVLLEWFVDKLTGSKLAGRIAPFLLFFSGGLGFLWFFKDYWTQGMSLLDFIGSMPRDYTIGEHFRWGNSMITLFITQRSLLLGMPLTLIVLGYLWKIFIAETQGRGEEKKVEETESRNSRTQLSILTSPFIVGLLAGTLPLIHLHSLAVLFIAGVFLFILKPEKWKEWVAFALGVAIIAVPELFWSMSGSANRATEFFGWHFGWDSGKDNFFVFWLKNTGITIFVLIAGMILAYKTLSGEGEEEKRSTDEEEKEQAGESRGITLLLFYLPFAFCFVVSNVAKLAPWEWDNIKVLIYWFVGSIPFIALALAVAWNKNTAGKVIAAACFVVLTLSGGLDVWRASTGQINIDVFDRDAVKVAEQIKFKTAPNALFLNAPTYNSAVVLSGRRSLMRYIGHLMSHGIDYKQREDDLNRIYEGGGTADIFLRKYDIDYVMVSPAERTGNAFRLNEEYFKKFPVVAESGPYKVYKVK